MWNRASKLPLWMLMDAVSLYVMAPNFALMNVRYGAQNNHVKLKL